MTSMILKIAAIIFALILLGVIIFARSKGVSPLSWKMHNPISQNNQIAIGGFDPVNYYENRNAKKGDASFSFSWNNANWYFTSLEHLDIFKANPAQYVPQFGGWCAFAVSKGFTAAPDPTVWFIQDKKLFLFADEGVKKQWVNQLPEVLETCNKKWTF